MNSALYEIDAMAELVIDAVIFLGRLLATVFFQIFVEFLILKPGYYLLRTVILRNKEDVDPNGPVVFALGFCFWMALFVIVYGIYALVNL